MSGGAASHLLACSLLIATGTAHSTAKDDDAAIRSVVAQVAEGAGIQQAERVAEVLHAEALPFFRGPDGLMRLTRDAYIGMFGAKEIGGTPRTLHAHSVGTNGNLAAASVTRQGEQARFEDYIALMKTEV